MVFLMNAMRCNVRQTIGMFDHFLGTVSICITRVFLTLGLIVFGNTFTAHHASAQSGLGIAAVVNDDVISMLDLSARTTMVINASGINSTPETRGRIAQQVLRGLIDEKLKLQETRKSGIKVSQADIERALQDIANTNKITVPQLTDNFNRMGVPITALTSKLESDIAWQAYVSSRLARRIQVGAEEINDEITRIEAAAGKPEYRLGEIFLPVDTPARDTEVRTMAERLVLQLQKGAPFSALAKNFSAAPSAAVGGDMGWVQLSSLDQALQNVIQRMKPGMASIPTRSLGGYYVMFLREVRTSPGLETGDATLRLSQYHVPFTDMDNKAALQQLTDKLTAYTRGMTSCQQLEAAGAKDGSLMSGSLGEMKLSNLPNDMRAILDTLPPGQPSQPVATGGGLAVMMICERNDEGRNMENIRTLIRNKLVNQRLEVTAQRKLRDLRRAAFVDIRL